MAIEQIAARFGLSELQFALGVIGILILILVALINLRSARSKRQARLHVEPVMGNDQSSRSCSLRYSAITSVSS